jgi:hypothetical protein
MTEPMPPVAQAVMTAATNGNFNVVNDPVYKQCIAAALKTAIDAGRRGPEHWEGSRPDDFDKGWEEALDWMAWVAAGLEGHD